MLDSVGNKPDNIRYLMPILTPAEVWEMTKIQDLQDRIVIELQDFTGFSLQGIYRIFHDYWASGSPVNQFSFPQILVELSLWCLV